MCEEIIAARTGRVPSLRAVASRPGSLQNKQLRHGGLASRTATTGTLFDAGIRWDAPLSRCRIATLGSDRGIQDVCGTCEERDANLHGAQHPLPVGARGAFCRARMVS